MVDKKKTRKELIEEIKRLEELIGKITHLQGLIEKVEEVESERKRAEAESEKATVFSDTLIASMKNGLAVLDNHGVHIDVNPAFCQMTGFSREELIGVGMPYPYWPPEE